MKSRSSLYVVFLLALTILVLSNLNSTQGGKTFQTTWGGTGNDVGQAVAVDSAGNIYVTGYTSSFPTSGTHVFLLKYDPSGNLLWQRAWGGANSEYGRGVGVDSQGNIYVTGNTASFGNGGNDVFLLKWNSSGGLLWQRTWGGSGDDLGFGLAVNASDSIYVVGRSYSLGNPDVILLKFDTSGSLLWQRAWGVTGGNYGQSVAIDSVGGVYVTGFTSSIGAGGEDVLLLKFDSSGNLKWQRTWGGTSDDEGYGVTVDPSNNVYVTGATQSAGAGNDDAFILKVTSSGNLVWQNTWGGANTDQGQGIATDSLGYVYVTGLTYSFGGSVAHVFLLSLSSGGKLLWQTEWGASGGTDFGQGIAAAGSGYSVTTGFVSEAGPYSNSSISGVYATSTLNMLTPNIAASTPTLGTQTVNANSIIPNGSTSYSGGEDSFLFKYGAPTRPTPPSGLSAVGAQRYVNLTWSPPAFNGFNSITGYNIYRGTSSGKETLLTQIGNLTRYTDPSVAGGVAYYYQVTAVNVIGESDFSNEALTNPVPTTPPTAPQSLTAVASTGQVQLSWSAPASSGGQSITGYNVYRGTTSGGETLLTVLGTQTVFSDTSVTGGTTYYYKVTAVNLVGDSAASNEASGTPVSAPTPPENLQAISSLGKIILSWNAPASNGGVTITGYNIYRGNSSGAETLLANIPNQLSYSDSQVNSSLTYFYKITVTNAIGSSGFSNEVSAKPSAKPTGPTAPLNLIATAGKGNITLTWNPPLSNGSASITGYNIYRGTAPSTETLHALYSNITTYVDTGVSIGTTYYYKVTAVNSLPQEGPYSNEANAVPFTTPSAPQNLQAFSGFNKIILSWNAPASNGASSLTGYRIYRGTSSGLETFLIAIGNQTSYVDTSVTALQSYYYNVTALNAAGESPHSAEASASASNSPTAPSPPQNLVATAGTGNVSLTWKLPLSNGGSSITGYELWKSSSSGSELKVAPLGNQTSYVDLGLQGGTPYYYYVKAVNSVGFSSPSNEAHATPVSVPTKPLNLVATAGSGKVTLNWTTPGSNGGLAIQGYKVYRGTSTGTMTLLKTINNGNQLSYVDTSVSGGTTYYYNVTAFNNIGESTPSNTANATPTTPPPPVYPPGPPTGLVATPGVTNITLTWSIPTNNGGAPITSYQIFRGTTSGSETLIFTTSLTSYNDTGLAPGTTYYYYVKAVNSAGLVTASSQVSEVSAVPLAPPTVPGSPLNLTATAGINSVNLTWSPPTSNGGSQITGYTILRGTSSGSETFYLNITNVQTYLDTSVSSGTTYYYQIKAINSIGTSNPSNEASAKPLAVTPPPPSFPIIPVAIAALVIVAVGAVGVIYWRRRVSQRLMMPP